MPSQFARMNPSAAPSTPSPVVPAETPLFRTGTLTYDAAGLRRLFFWLLTGDVVFTLIDQIEPKVLPVILKLHGASDTEIAFIVSSITALMQFFVIPVVSYRSDRLRSRWGRRIPFIFWCTPLVSLLLAITPFAPEIAAWSLGVDGVGPWIESLPFKPVILWFGVLAVAYRFVQAAVSTMFMCLFRDVVPMSHMGRFLALFRVFGALSTFVITYWLLGIAETHAKPIFLGIAALNLVGFLAMCWFVREGEYPPVVERVPAVGAAGRWAFLRVAQRFTAECFSHPVYWWTYLTRTLIYGAIPVSGFIIFFPQRELGLTLDQTGKLMSWSALAWLLIAYPLGRLIDRWGSMRVLGLGLAVSAIGYGLSFFFVVGSQTFLISCLVTGIAYWVVMLSQSALTQEIFSQARFAQLGSANVMLQSIVIAFVISPLAGGLLDSMKDFHAQLPIPGFGTVEIGRYRFVNMMLAAIYGLALVGLWQVRRHRRKHTDAAGVYHPPV